MGYSFSDMESRRIAELLDPFLNEPVSHALSGRQLDQISIYIDLLLRWNARINLTAVRKPEEIVTRHFGESLFAARHLFSGTKDGATGVPAVESGAQQPTQPASLVDLGSGAGFPGIPIKIWFPSTPVTLIESNQKKVVFLREVIRALTLTDINVFPARAETYPAASAPVLTVRAVERFEQILPTAARLLLPGGTLVLLIGQSQLSQARFLLPSLIWSDPQPIPLSTSRVLICATRAGERRMKA